MSMDMTVIYVIMLLRFHTSFSRVLICTLTFSHQQNVSQHAAAPGPGKSLQRPPVHAAENRGALTASRQRTEPQTSSSFSGWWVVGKF